MLLHARQFTHRILLCDRKITQHSNRAMCAVFSRTRPMNASLRTSCYKYQDIFQRN